MRNLSHLWMVLHQYSTLLSSCIVCVHQQTMCRNSQMIYLILTGSISCANKLQYLQNISKYCGWSSTQCSTLLFNCIAHAHHRLHVTIAKLLYSKKSYICRKLVTWAVCHAVADGLLYCVRAKTLKGLTEL